MRRLHEIPSVFGLITSAWATSSLLWTFEVYAQSPRDLDLNDPGDAGSALLFLQLYNEGLAGGKSGVCLDLTYDGGKPRYRAAFDTEAFVTGQSDFKSGSTFNPEGFKRLAQAIAKANGGETQVSIDGYADGQHFQTEGYSVEKSIEKNRALAAARAKQIEGLFVGQPGIKVSEVEGHASPYWERARPAKSGGLNCPTRRKVVVSFDAPESKISSKASGGYLGAPVRLESKIYEDLKTEFENSIKESAKQIPAGAAKGVDSQVSAIFEAMIKNGKITPACRISPFAEITKAKIESMIVKDRPLNVTVKNWLPEGYSMNEKGLGKPALEVGCFVPSSGLSSQISEKQTAVSGAEMIKKDKISAKSGKMTIGYSAKGIAQGMKPTDVKYGPHKDEKQRGYYCSACGYGLFFNADSKSGDLKPQYLDRMIDSRDPVAQERFLKALNEFENADPFAVASMVKPRMFMIRNCKDCNCDTKSRIRSGHASVTSFDPVENNQPDQSLSVGELEQTCMIHPPLMHACGNNVIGEDGKASSKIKQELQYQMALQNLEVTGANINELVNKVDQACSASPKRLPAEKIRDVQCDPAKNTQLPSDDEKADCDQYDALDRQKGP